MAAARSIPGVCMSLRLSATSVNPTLGWKKIGASSSDNTESTPSRFLRSDWRLFKRSIEDWEKRSSLGSIVIIKKLESPNSSSVSW